MNVWLILWAILAISLVVFMVWTFSILMRQKRAWQLYAEKRKLRYKPNSLMDSPEIDGVIGEHTVSLFASEHDTPDARGVRKLTAVEINLNSKMPVDGGVASGGMIPILKLLKLKQEYLPKHSDWKKSYVASSNSRNVMAAYLTDDRIAGLCEVMEIENAWGILVFKDDAMLLRIDIADPLHSAKRLDELVKSMLKVADVLELKSGEGRRLKSESLKTDIKDVEIEVDADALDTGTSLVLEEDFDEPEVEAGAPSEEAKAEEKPAAAEKSKPKKNAKGKKPSASSKSSKTKK